MKGKIEQYFEVHRDEYLKDLEQLIAIDSSRGDAQPGKPYGDGPASALEKTLRMAEQYGLYTENWENYLGIIQLKPGDERVLDIFAHLDVVPGGDGWTMTEPFVMKLVDGKVYGRGAIDDKGPALAAIYALRAIKELKIDVKENVRIMVGCSEEYGAPELKHYWSKTKPAPMSFTPDGVFPVANIEKGCCYGNFEATFSENDRLPYLVSAKSGNKINVIPGRAEAVVKGMAAEELQQYLTAESIATGADFSLKEKGQDEIEIICQGIGGHASTPHLCNNALTAMVQLLAKLPLADSRGHNFIQNLARLFPHGDTCGKEAGIFMEDDISGQITVSLNLFEFEREKLFAAFDSRVPICANEENLKPVKVKAEQAGFSFQFSLCTRGISFRTDITAQL